MRRIKIVLFLLVLAIVIDTGLGYAQPKIPKDKILSNIPPEVREQVEKLYSQSSAERTEAIEKLGGMGEKAAPAIPFLIAMLADAGDSTLLVGIGASGEIFEWKLVAFSPSTGKQDIPIGQKAAVALSKMGKAAVMPLTVALKDKDFVVRFNAVEALANIKDNRAVEPLIATLKDEYPPVRFNAAVALGNIKDLSAIIPTEALLKDNDYAVQQAAVEALKSITGKNYKGDLPKRHVEPAFLSYEIGDYRASYKKFRY